MPRSLRATFRTRRRWTVAEASAAVSALASSRLSVAAFSRREGLVAERLYRWRRQLRSAAKRGSTTPSFVELRPATPSTVEIVLRSGLVLRVQEAIDEGALRRLVEVLERPAPC